MSNNSSCASSAAPTPTLSSERLAIAAPLVIRIPTAPVMTTASPPSPSWRVIEPRPQDDSDDFRPPGLLCYSTTPANFRRETDSAQSRQPLATVDRPNEVVKPGIAHTPCGDNLADSGVGRVGKTSAAGRNGTSRHRPYDPTGLPPLKEALYAASRASLKYKPEEKAETTATQLALPHATVDPPNPSSAAGLVVNEFPPGIKVVGRTGDGKPDLVPISPTAQSSPRASGSAPPLPKPDVPLLSSVPLQIPVVHSPAPDPAPAWASVPASLPARFPSQPSPQPFPESYPELPQWQRLSLLRSDYASNTFSAKAHSLEVHARDYRAGILLLSLLDVLRDRQRYIAECRHDMQQMARNVTEMEQMGYSWREMGVAESHGTVNEFFKSMWGCEFEDVGMREDGTTSTVPSKRWPELKESGASGASLPVGHIPGYPDGVHLPSLERLIGIPIRRSDGKMCEFDVQKMGRAFAEDPFEVLKGLVRGVDGSKYAPLEI